MIKNNQQLIILSQRYYDLCCGDILLKIAKIKKLPNGQYRVVSKKGKNLGTYQTKEEAVERLRQVEYFKHKKAEINKELTYSSLFRLFRTSKNDDLLNKFKKIFKEKFDESLINNLENPEKISLIQTILELSKDEDLPLSKSASAIQLGNPEFAGKYLSNIIKFLMQRISSAKRPKSTNNLKKKIYYINEYEIASKKVPPSSAMGQSITLLKTILLDHDPKYIRAILNSIVRNL